MSFERNQGIQRMEKWRNKYKKQVKQKYNFK